MSDSAFLTDYDKFGLAVASKSNSADPAGFVSQAFNKGGQFSVPV